VSLPFRVGDRKPNILDFDVECRPLSWYGGDWVTKDVTAIAWAWANTDYPICCVAQGDQPGKFKDPLEDIESMLHNFREAYDAADVVTGHFIRGFDLPVLNAACLEVGLPPLGPKMASDTKIDLVKFSGLSKSQENLGALLGLEHPKVQMDQVKWREANRLTPIGVELACERVIGDVAQHMELRTALLDRGMLGPPRLWQPHSNGASKGYAP
jgi:hypothetical protein